MVSSSPEHQKTEKKLWRRLIPPFAGNGVMPSFFLWFMTFFIGFTKKRNIIFKQLRKRISEYQNMDTDYNIGHYGSEMRLSGLGNRGYSVTFGILSALEFSDP